MSEPTILDSITVYVRFADVDAEWLRLNGNVSPGRATRGVSIGDLARRMNTTDPENWVIARTTADMQEKRYKVVLTPKAALPDDEAIIAELG